MRFRKLRIAWSVFWGLATALLIVLWVRSYWRLDTVDCPTSRPLMFVSGDGIFQIVALPIHLKAALGPDWHWEVKVLPRGTDEENEGLARRPSWMYRSNQHGTGVNFPARSVVVLLALASVAPWLRRRFSLRTLLIVTTLVAVVLW